MKFFEENPPNLPLGEGGPVGAGRGAAPGPGSYRPTPVPGFARSTLSQERVLNLPLGEGGPQGRKRGGTKSEFVPPHTRLGFAEPPSPRRGFCPPPEEAFPSGEGGTGKARDG